MNFQGLKHAQQLCAEAKAASGAANCMNTDLHNAWLVEKSRLADAANQFVLDNPNTGKVEAALDEYRTLVRSVVKVMGEYGFPETGRFVSRQAEQIERDLS